jgi:hypothetical protein
MTISNQQLRRAFLSPAMQHYFEKKLAHVSPAELRMRIEEALKFLNIAAFCHGNIPVTKEIDEIWHYWILETQEYKRLCRVLQGGRFLHHRSNAYMEYFEKDIVTRGNDLEHDVAMLSTYVSNYGPFKKERVRYWVLADYLVQRCGWTVRELNGWLASTRKANVEQPVHARLRSSKKK